MPALTPDAAGHDPAWAELLAGCAREPIHIPGAVQPHGSLLAFRQGVAVIASADASEHLGRRLTDVFGEDATALITREASGQPLTVTRPDGQTTDVVTHRQGELLIVEAEPPSDVDLDGRLGVLGALRRIQAAGSTNDLVGQTATAVRELTGFDRVMVYRFDEEWVGEVVAEDRSDGLDPFLGLRYPASDIPPQARDLYLRNPIRLIPDAHHTPVPLVSVPGNEDVAPLDLSDATLRAVSPVHLEYLRNMGVMASMSAAVVVDGRLWGLVACHHYSGARRPSQRVRAAVDVVTRTASAVLAQLLVAADALERFELLQRLDTLSRVLADAEVDPLGALTAAGTALPDLVAADGAATWRAGVVTSTGHCPPPAAIDRLVSVLTDDGHAAFVTSHAAGAPAAADSGICDHAAGVLARHAGDDGAWLLWFRREEIESVRWGGNPAHKELQRDASGGVRLGPRRSFAEYVELIHARSRPWRDNEIDIAAQLARRVGEGAERQLRRDRQLADALQRAVLLDGLPDVPGADVCVVYEPATRMGLGGDWYDLFFLRDGRAVVVLGDVAGHGFEVAATMAQLRHALRAYIVRTGDIADALGELNDLVRTLLPNEMATVVIAVFDADNGTVEMLSAGHLPPVHVTPAGAALLELPRHPALGLRHSVPFRTTTLELRGESTLVLYTDGLIERRTVGIDERLAALVAAAAKHRHEPPGQICTILRDDLRDERREDDATVFALRLDAHRD